MQIQAPGGRRSQSCILQNNIKGKSKIQILRPCLIWVKVGNYLKSTRAEFLDCKVLKVQIISIINLRHKCVSLPNCLAAGQAAPISPGTTLLAFASSPVSTWSTHYFIMLFTKIDRQNMNFVILLCLSDYWLDCSSRKWRTQCKNLSRQNLKHNVPMLVFYLTNKCYFPTGS